MSFAFRFLFALSLLVGAALAAADSPAEPTPWYPATGAWAHQTEDGIYYHVSVGPDGYVFVVLTLFRADGEPTFLVMQGPFVPTSLAQWRSTGVTGSLRSPLYRMQDGPTLGGAYRSPGTTPSEFGDAEIEFRNDARAVFRHGGRETSIALFPLYVSEAGLPRARLDGRWQLHWRDASGETDAVLEFGATRGTLAERIGRPLPTGDVAQFGRDELLSVGCVDCRRSQQRVFRIGNLLGAKSDGTLRFFAETCTRITGCSAPVSAIVHERDGTLFVRGLDQGGNPFEATLQRMGPRCGAHFYDCSLSTTPSAMPVTTWSPQPGFWWTPAENGVYHQISVGPDGTLFVAITLFDAAGAPTFLIMQGSFEATTIEQWADTDEIGRLRSPLYRMSGGQALGGAYRRPTTSASAFGNAEIVFFSGHRAEFRHDGRATPITTFPLYTTAAGLPQNRLQGRWVAVSRLNGTALETGLIDIVPATSAPGSAPRLAFRCVDCDSLIETVLDPAAVLEIGNGLHRLFDATVTGTPPFARTLDFHERDGMLLGRTARGRLDELHPDLRYAANFDLVLLKLDR